jgi:hypothetical protein
MAGGWSQNGAAGGAWDSVNAGGVDVLAATPTRAATRWEGAALPLAQHGPGQVHTMPGGWCSAALDAAAGASCEGASPCMSIAIAPPCAMPSCMGHGCNACASVERATNQRARSSPNARRRGEWRMWETM